MRSCETDDQAQDRVKSAIKLVGNELLTLKVLVSSEKMRQGARLQALKELLKKQYFLISFSHHRKYDPEDFIRFVKKNGVDWDKMEQFCKKYGLDVKCYPIY